MIKQTARALVMLALVAGTAEAQLLQVKQTIYGMD